MPGIVTHSRILKEALQFLSQREKKSYLLNSIATLFNSPENLTAGLFGALGPDIFDYIPRRNGHAYYGNDISFFIHNGGSYKLLRTMIENFYTYEDKNNEWASIQRAYLYGFISHIIADSVFHPFIFYYSGFPNVYTKKEIFFFREQNLLFQYHLDNFLQYHAERANNFSFSVDEMLPLKKKKGLYHLDPAVKSYILGSIKQTYPEIYQKLIFPIIKQPDREYPPPVTCLDLVPYLIRMTYRLKRSSNRRLATILEDIRRSKFILSDFTVHYPMNRKYNKNILNLHRERWENPAGKPGLHYESVYNLLAISCEKTIGLWETIESSLYGKKNIKALEELNINAYTGDAQLSYHDMKLKRPVRLSS
jgi:hypothetical protein